MCDGGDDGEQHDGVAVQQGAGPGGGGSRACDREDADGKPRECEREGRGRGRGRESAGRPVGGDIVSRYVLPNTHYRRLQRHISHTLEGT